MIDFIRIDPSQAHRIAAAMGPNLRAEDAAECAAFGMTSYQAVFQSIKSSVFCMTAWDGPDVIAAFGITVPNVLGNQAQPWLITTPKVLQHKKLFLRMNKKFIENVRQIFPYLETLVHAEYEQALRWIFWLGFKVYPPVSAGPLGERFCRVTLGEDA
jgi:hypothetical protein